MSSRVELSTLLGVDYAYVVACIATELFRLNLSLFWYQ